VTPNESLEGTLIVCSILSDADGQEMSLAPSITTDKSSVVQTSFVDGIEPEQGSLTISVDDDGGNDMESQFASPASGGDGVASVATSPSSSNETPPFYSPVSSPTNDTINKDPTSSNDPDLFFIAWARDALSKLKRGEIVSFGS